MITAGIFISNADQVISNSRRFEIIFFLLRVKIVGFKSVQVKTGATVI